MVPDTRTSQLAQIDPEIDAAVRDLRAAYAGLLGALPGPPQNPTEVARQLGLNAKLSWQLFRTATSEDPLASGAGVPGPTTVAQVAREARKAGVSPEIADRVVDVTHRFHEVAGRHAETRSEFDLMVRAVTGEGLDTHNHDLKRTAFRANRELFGKCAHVDLYTLIVWPGPRDGVVSMCSLRGLIDLYRLRPNARLEVSRHRYDRAGGEVQHREPVPGAPASEDRPAGLLTEFSSPNLPPIRQTTSSDGFTRWFADTPVLGRSAAITCFLADITRNSRYIDPEGAAVGHIHEIATPSRVLVQDCLIHESLCENMTPEMRVLARRSDAERWPGEDTSAQLPVPETMRDMGQAMTALPCREAPRYAEMVEDVVGRLGWETASLRLYRTRVEFPVTGSVVWMRFGFDR